MPKVLFFIHGPVPSDSDKEAAAALEQDGKEVCFRNLRWIDEDAGIEKFDELAGAVPAMYADFLERLENDEEFKAMIDPPVRNPSVEIVGEEDEAEELSLSSADAAPPVARAKRVRHAMEQKNKDSLFGN